MRRLVIERNSDGDIARKYVECSIEARVEASKIIKGKRAGRGYYYTLHCGHTMYSLSAFQRGAMMECSRCCPRCLEGKCSNHETKSE